MEILSWKNVVYGKNRVRRNYSRVQTTAELPNLIEVQTKSFDWFATEGIKELFSEISPIKDHGEKLELYFGDFEFDEPKYSITEAKRNVANYSRPLKVPQGVIIGNSPKKIFCSLISPVSVDFNFTSTFNGRE